MWFESNVERTRLKLCDLKINVERKRLKLCDLKVNVERKRQKLCGLKTKSIVATKIHEKDQGGINLKWRILYLKIS